MNHPVQVQTTGTGASAAFDAERRPTSEAAEAFGKKAARLLALALEARERGNDSTAEILAKAAAGTFEETAALEAA
jgi:hypothetical protein